MAPNISPGQFKLFGDAPLEGSSPSRLSSQFVQPQLPFEEG